MLSPPATEYEFAGQATHAADDTAATDVLYKSTPHNAQAAEPAVALYDPAAHAVHVPPSAPVWPATQTQIVDALRDCAFVGHRAHVLAREAPAVAENVLTPQLTQALAAVAPGVVRYLPAPQSAQVAAEEAP